MHKAIYFLLFLLLFARVAFSHFSQKRLPDGTEIRLSQKVITEPVRYETAQYLKLHGLKIYLPLYPEIGYGDKVVIEGIVQGDKLKNPKLISISQDKNYLYKLRQNIIAFYKANIPEPHASLVAGVTLGSKSQISENFWENLKKTGTAHVVVASGMNVTLVAGFALSFLVLFIPRLKAIYMATIIIWLYTIISGLDAPLLRAAIMGTIGFIAVGIGKVNEAKHALFVAAYAMLLVNPAWISDLGFILSFVATLSLILFGVNIDRKLSFVPRGFREGLATSLSAQIGVAPILYITFGQFSIFSPLVNALVLWAIGPLTIIGMIAGLVGLMAPVIGRLLLFLVYPLTLWFVSVVNLFS